VSLFVALGAAATMSAFPAAASQLAKEQKQAAASGQQTSGGQAPLRVMLVISDQVRSYQTYIRLVRVEYGRRLAKQAERVFDESFRTVKIVAAPPTDPSGYEGIDVVVTLGMPQGEQHAGLFPGITGFDLKLTESFVVTDVHGQEVFRAEEVASDKVIDLGKGGDTLGETVVRKFLQEMFLNPRIRELLSPAPQAAPKVVLEDTAAMDSAGLDVPPPPPWAAPNSAGSGTPSPGGKP
jgi:hypothetical protein